MIETFHLVSCDGPGRRGRGCDEVGPAATSRVEAWQLARDERGWTLHRMTSKHYCPACSPIADAARRAARAERDAR